jgi:hypothetical protein
MQKIKPHRSWKNLGGEGLLSMCKATASRASDAVAIISRSMVRSRVAAFYRLADGASCSLNTPRRPHNYRNNIATETASVLVLA